MPAELPFSIDVQLAERGQALFCAMLDGQAITSERYSPGDGTRRRRTAKEWAANARLCNGSEVAESAIVSALDEAEQAALSKRAEIENEAADAEDVEPIECASYADDGLIVELGWNRKRGSADFIIYSREQDKPSRAAEINTSIGLIIPPSICTGIVTPGGDVPGNIYLPTYADEAGHDEPALRAALAAFINRYVELPGASVEIAVVYVLLSWVFGEFDEMAYLGFRTADVGRGKSRALETVGALCYRPIFAGGGSSAPALLRLIDIYGGTLCCDEFDAGHDTELASAITRILNQGFQRGRPLVKCDGESNAPRPFRCFGPKVFALRKQLGDDATESRTLFIQMQQRTRADIPLSLPRRQFDAEALALRNKLLAWRFANVGKITIDPTLADPGLEDRSNQIGLPLLAVARSKHVRARIVVALREQQGTIAQDRADTLAGEVFRAILGIAEPGDVIHPGEVAAAVNQARADADSTEPDKLGKRAVDSRKIGWVLRGDLELPRDSRARDRLGARYCLDAGRVDQLAKRFGGPPPGSSTTSQRHVTQERHTENALFDSAKAECDVDVDGDVLSGMGGDTGDDTPIEAPEPAEWSPETAALIEWFGANRDRLPTAPFSLRPGTKVAKTDGFYRGLDQCIQAGPNSPRAKSGALQADLEALRQINEQPAEAEGTTCP